MATVAIDNISTVNTITAMASTDDDKPDALLPLPAATFHILTPYPGTGLYKRMSEQGRMTVDDWDLYDTRHVVYRPTGLTAAELKRGYDWSYREFYTWPNIAAAASAHDSLKHSLKHFAYSAGWKKFEPAWDFVIRVKQLAQMRPMLEAVLSPVRRRIERTAALPDALHSVHSSK